MVVAARTRNRQAQHTSGQCVDTIVPLIGQGLGLFAIVLVIDGTQSKQSQCRQSTWIAGASQQITGNLFRDKLIVGEIAIQRVDDPVTIAVSLRIIASFKSVCLVFAVAGDIQPMPSPTLAVMRRLEQSIHDDVIGIWRSIIKKRGDFFRRGGKTDHIEVSPPNQRASLGHRAGLDSRLFQPGEDESVQIASGPFGLLHVRNRGSPGSLE